MEANLLEQESLEGYVVTKAKELWVTSEENKRVYARFIDLLS